MKLETVQKLQWPWPTKWVYLLKKNGSVEYRHKKESWGKSYDLQEVIQDPSVEEMLERMPNFICKNASDPVLYKAIIWSDRDLSVGYRSGKGEGFMLNFPEDLAEALALLCIWLRDNKLMEWIYKEEEEK